MGVCFVKKRSRPLLSKEIRKERKDGFHEQSEGKKGLSLAKKHNLTGWAFLLPATLLIGWMSFLSDDSGVHTVSSDRYGCKPEL